MKGTLPAAASFLVFVSGIMVLCNRSKPDADPAVVAALTETPAMAPTQPPVVTPEPVVEFSVLSGERAAVDRGVLAAYDLNRDGVLSLREMEEAEASVGHGSFPGGIDIWGFTPLQGEALEAAEDTFDQTDEDGDGVLTLYELQQVPFLAVTELGELDANGDGVLSFSEVELVRTPYYSRVSGRGTSMDATQLERWKLCVRLMDTDTDGLVSQEEADRFSAAQQEAGVIPYNPEGDEDGSRYREMRANSDRATVRLQMLWHECVSEHDQNGDGLLTRDDEMAGWRAFQQNPEVQQLARTF